MWKRIKSNIAICELCGITYLQYESNKMWNNCLSCIQIISRHGYYENDGELKITKKGLEKLWQQQNIKK